MVPMMSLLLPIVLSAVAVFVLSSIIHMLLRYHRNDFGRVAAEAQVMDALRPFNIPPGEYVIPAPPDNSNFKAPEYVEKLKRGPVGFFTIMPNGPFNMVPQLVQWFLYALFVSAFAAYVAGRARGPDATYLEVFRFAGSAALASYGFAQIQSSIWFRRSWGVTIKNLIDALIYALVTAGIFGWLWPR
jgi:hypothetical protein